MKKFLFILFFEIFFFAANSQQLIDFNQNSPKIRWENIETEHFSLIFPDEIENDAQKVANFLEFQRNSIQKSLSVETTKWKIILSNKNAISNGYVTLSPKRSEWFSTPPQEAFNGTLEWYQSLALHETRHMAQYDKFNKGFIKGMSYFFGENGRNLFSTISFPMWFWEGDATLTETLLSKSGRGRLPGFDIVFRTHLLTEKPYSFYKAYLRSYKDYVANHYVLGYFLATKIRKNGTETLEKICEHTSRNGYSPFAFARSLKIFTEKNSRETYEATISELDSLYKKQIEDLTFTEIQKINTKTKKVFTNYFYPQFFDSSYVVAFKSGLSDAGILMKIRISDGKEEKIKQIPSFEGFSMDTNKIIWTEYHTHPRWGNESFSNIAVYHWKTKKLTFLTENQRYFSSSISPDGQKIVTVEFTTDRKCSLLILDSETGKICKRFPNPNNLFIAMPSWSQDGKKIVFTSQSEKGKALILLDTTTNFTKILIPEGNENIARPIFFQNFVLYESPYSGIDNIYAVDTANFQRFQVISRKFGCYNPMLLRNSNSLIFNDYANDGMNIGLIKLFPSEWKKIELIIPKPLEYFKPLLSQEEILTDENIPQKIYSVKNYNAFLSLRLHSWVIIPFPTNLVTQLYFKDIFNSTIITAGGQFNANEKVYNGNFDVAYAGFYPIFEFGGNFGTRNITYKNATTQEDETDIWHETSASIGGYLPLVKNRGDMYLTYLNLGMKATCTDISGKEYYQQFENRDGIFFPISYELVFSHKRRGSSRDLESYGPSFAVSYRHTPAEGDYDGKIFSLYSSWVFGSFGFNDALMLDLGYEKQSPVNYRFQSQVPFVRGFLYQYFDKFYRASGIYEVPLFYPDFPLGAVFYLKRIKGAIFYDYGKGFIDDSKQVYRSAGFDVRFDILPFSLPLSLDLGWRCAFLIEDKKWVNQFLFMGVNL